MQNRRKQLHYMENQNQVENKPPARGALEKHRRLIVCVIGAMVVFIVLHQVWFFVMGGFAVIGAIWAICEYNKKEKEF